jgi:membrane dipeptidase
MTILIPIAGVAVALLLWTVLVQLEWVTAERFFGHREAEPDGHIWPEAARFHENLRVADLHADTLIWRRDLLRRSRLGNFDFPRMRDGGGAVQGFLAVTEAPNETEGGNLSDKSDRLTLLGVVDQWPLAAIRDQTERALYMARKLHRFCDRSQGTIRFVTKRSDLEQALEDRKTDPSICAVILGLEGSDGTKYQLDNIERLFDAGYRMAELCHYTDTPFAASSSGVSRAGLSPLGRDAVLLMNSLGMIPDLAHASVRTIGDVLELSSHAPLITHTGSASCCTDPKCLIQS